MGGDSPHPFTVTHQWTPLPGNFMDSLGANSYFYRPEFYTDNGDWIIVSISVGIRLIRLCGGSRQGVGVVPMRRDNCPEADKSLCRGG